MDTYSTLGTVHTLKQDIWGNETILSVSKKNQLFGETFAGSNNPVSSVSFYAARNTEVLSVPFHRIMHTCTPVSYTHLIKT